MPLYKIPKIRFLNGVRIQPSRAPSTHLYTVPEVCEETDETETGNGINLARTNFEELVGPIPANFNTTPGKLDPSDFRNQRYLCQKYSKYGDCVINGCSSFHKPVDLSYKKNYPTYKTKLCNDYHNNGYCISGCACANIHEESLSELIDRFRRPIVGRGEMLDRTPYDEPLRDPNMKLPRPILGRGEMLKKQLE